jgi:competence protein ComEC
MKLTRTASISFSLFILLLMVSSAPAAPPRTLDIYFIDVEGGAATLIVTPLGESLLIDSGFPGDRDAGRIAHVAHDVAGLQQIDHYVSTHWHRDHFGGVPKLTQLIPIKHFYDHGLPTETAADIQPELIEAYRQTVGDKSITLTAGDNIKLRPATKYLPPLQVRVLTANGLVVGEQPNVTQVQPCGPNFQSIPEDKTDNYKSLSFLLTFGRFRFFNGGDITWNIENRLVCPKNIPGAVDVYQVNHHGVDNSNNPSLIRNLKPRVAIIDNGPRKGAEARTFATLHGTPETAAIYQLHRNLRTTDKDNAPADYIANDAEECKGEFIKLSVAADSKSYTVSIPSKQITRTYKTR